MIAPAFLRRFPNARRGGHVRCVRAGDDLVQRFVALSGLRADDRVLAVGSGVGRIGFAPTTFLDEPGRYEGFDADGVRRAVVLRSPARHADPIPITGAHVHRYSKLPTCSQVPEQHSLQPLT